MSAVKYIPVPYFLIDKGLTILQCSDIAIETFGDATLFLDIIDRESKEKAERILTSHETKTTELVMKTITSPYFLFKLKVNWADSVGHVICIEQDERIQELIEAVNKHRLRLAETNFELLEKKEQLETSLALINELSAPYIILTKGIVLIPLYGHLKQDLIDSNSLRILQQINNNSEIVRILFDFHGIGNITTEGIVALRNLLTQITLMGVLPYIIGLHPDHAQLIHKSGIKTESYFMRNINDAIRKFIV